MVNLEYQPMGPSLYEQAKAEAVVAKFADGKISLDTLIADAEALGGNWIQSLFLGINHVKENGIGKKVTTEEQVKIDETLEKLKSRLAEIK